MTIGGWIIFSGSAALIMISGLLIPYVIFDGFCKEVYITIAVCGAIVVVILCGMLWYYGNTESGKRAFKTQKSDLEGGINRDVKVYDATGGLIKEYSGKFDIEYDDDRILFDDENGKRHTIYYPTGTVIIDEVEE